MTKPREKASTLDSIMIASYFVFLLNILALYWGTSGFKESFSYDTVVLLVILFAPSAIGINMLKSGNGILPMTVGFTFIWTIWLPVFIAMHSTIPNLLSKTTIPTSDPALYIMPLLVITSFIYLTSSTIAYFLRMKEEMLSTNQ